LMLEELDRKEERMRTIDGAHYAWLLTLFRDVLVLAEERNRPLRRE